MPSAPYVDLPFPEAVKELALARRLGGRNLFHYYETLEDEIARIEANPGVLRVLADAAPDWRDKARRRHRPMKYVRYFPEDAGIAGDLDLDFPFSPGQFAGVAVDGDLEVQGSLINWETDAWTSFLSVVGSVSCKDFVIGSADIVVLGNVRADGIIVATYNHGWLEINGNVSAKLFIIDDDREAWVRGGVQARGWTSSENAHVDLPLSDWKSELRPEFYDEFFLPDGDFRNPGGNASLVEALMAGRDILKPRRTR